MADDFGAQDLEDGELWLPSDFFSMDEAQLPSKTPTPVGSHSFSKATCMVGFQRVAHNNGLCEALQTLQRFKPAVYGGVSREAARDPCGRGMKKSWTGCLPVTRFQNPNPVQDQIEAFMAERARAEERQQLNRVLLQAGMGARGGTGVFLPRVSNTAAKKGKGPRLNSSHKFHLPPSKNLLNRSQEVYSGYGPTDEVCMPNYWSY
ncbi:anaerobic dimethyl sulfoxide reductase [Striga asiatica]|uniref:Anaerobic dimethyl sulfoxide reductase n=1 Tax=Striga asiatica TaxID=4170 RepID=A0A5A7Q9W5_STRAF|nr:anaerobic dimethyl sulfoxide reductase [Striga asiatica]